MNIINLDFRQESAELKKICAEHSKCIGCPLIGGQQYSVNGSNVICETGKSKKRE